jgi:pimeloyl-ACP methyl ester carboxylesterase
VKLEVFASVSKTPANAFASALDGLRSFDAARAVESYHGRLLAIAVTSTESPSSLHKQVPSIAVVKMEGVSHWKILDKPQEFNRILDDFLRTVDASEARH